MNRPEKVCASCGRPMVWRKAWEKNWDSIRYCSDSCRRDKLDKNSLHVREAILLAIKNLDPSKTICPIEIAKSLWSEWESHLEEVRRVGRILHHEKLIVIIQNGKPIKDLNFKGPVFFKTI